MRQRLVLFSAAALALSGPAGATTELLDFSIGVNNQLSDFDISFALVGNDLGLTGSAGLVPEQFDIIGTIEGQIYRDVETGQVTFVDTLSADLSLIDFSTERSDYAIEGAASVGALSVTIEGTVEDPGIFTTGPTGPRPVNSPFDATLAFGNRGVVDVDAILPPVLGGPVNLFNGDLETVGSTFTIPFEGDVQASTAFPIPNLFEIEYAFDGRIEIIELPIPGGGTAVMDVDAKIRSNLFVAQSSGFVPDPGVAPIPGPLPVVSLLSALGLVVALRRRL